MDTLYLQLIWVSLLIHALAPYLVFLFSYCTIAPWLCWPPPTAEGAAEASRPPEYAPRLYSEQVVAEKQINMRR